ncbi:hypothetical protein CIW54_25360 [Paraburkholderia sp. T12-10]|nr:hypothetical protein CIW54_25360 [Paraburkholderia sp. T12-10]
MRPAGRTKKSPPRWRAESISEETWRRQVHSSKPLDAMQHDLSNHSRSSLPWHNIPPDEADCHASVIDSRKPS